MKHTNFLSISLTLLMIIVMTSCEFEQSKPLSADEVDREAIQLRTDCEDCSGISECCCAVKLQSGETLANLSFCGTSNGTGDCDGEATGNCSSFSGGGQSITLTSFSLPSEQFCVNENSPFWVRNTNPTSNARFIITCRAEELNADTLHVDLDPGEFLYLETDGNCNLGPCGS